MPHAIMPVLPYRAEKLRDRRRLRMAADRCLSGMPQPGPAPCINALVSALDTEPLVNWGTRAVWGNVEPEPPISSMPHPHH